MLAKWLNDELEGKELETFMASPEYAVYNKIKEYSAQLTVPEGDMDSLYERIQRNRDKQTKVRTLNPWLPRVAAMLVMALGVTYFFYTTNTTTQLADNGNRTEFLLPDNSQVVLNAGSTAEYREWNWSGNRKVELDGEAYFKVAKGQKFDVVTELGTVTVVGTQFNVKERDGRLDVTCFEGKVKVTAKNNEILLTPGMSVAFQNGKLAEMPADDDTQPGWLHYEVEFRDVPLASVISEMERQYNIDIDLTAKKEMLFNGHIPMNDIATALDMIKTASHLKSEKAGNKIILSVE